MATRHTNSNLTQARSAKNDEFYTKLVDVESEMEEALEEIE